MGMRIIPVRVQNEYVIGAGVSAGGAGSHGDVALRLAFSGDMWDGTAKTVCWRDSLGNAYSTELDASMLEVGEDEVYVVPIPAGPKAYPGKMRMSVKGESGSATVYSEAAEFVVLESVQAQPSEEDKSEE